MFLCFFIVGIICNNLIFQCICMYICRYKQVINPAVLCLLQPNPYVAFIPAFPTQRVNSYFHASPRLELQIPQSHHCHIPAPVTTSAFCCCCCFVPVSPASIHVSSCWTGRVREASSVTRDVSLPPPLTGELRSSGLLRSE